FDHADEWTKVECAQMHQSLTCRDGAFLRRLGRETRQCKGEAGDQQSDCDRDAHGISFLIEWAATNKTIPKFLFTVQYGSTPANHAAMTAARLQAIDPRHA